MLTEAEEAEIVARYQAGNAQALFTLMLAHEPFVRKMVRRWGGNRLPDDLMAEGRLGLVLAARKFDTAKGVRFNTYAAWWVRNRVSRYALATRRIVAPPGERARRDLLRNIGRKTKALRAELGREPTTEEVAERAGVTVEDVEAVRIALATFDVPHDHELLHLVSSVPLPDERIDEKQEGDYIASAVRDAIAKLRDGERNIVRLRLLEGLTLREVGDRVGLTHERVRQIEARALERLRQLLAGLAAEAGILPRRVTPDGGA